MKRGFTLVELLVVIAIIALLLSILMPSLSSAREQGRAVVCASNVWQMGLGLQLYATDYRDSLPAVIDYQYGKATNDSRRWSKTWISDIESYMGLAKDKMWGLDVGRCPSNKQEPSKEPSTYGCLYTTVFAWWDPTINAFYTKGSAKLIKVPSTVSMVLDATCSWSEWHWIYTPQAWTFDIDRDGDGILDTYRITGRPKNYRYNGFNPVHNKRGNALFSDGAVRKIPLMDWIKNKNGIWGADAAALNSGNGPYR